MDRIALTRSETTALWAQDALMLTDDERDLLAHALVRPALTRDERSLMGGIALMVTTDPSMFERTTQERMERLVERAVHRWNWTLREPDRERIRAAWIALTIGEEAAS